MTLKATEQIRADTGVVDIPMTRFEARVVAEALGESTRHLCVEVVAQRIRRILGEREDQRGKQGGNDSVRARKKNAAKRKAAAPKRWPGT